MFTCAVKSITCPIQDYRTITITYYLCIIISFFYVRVFIKGKVF